MCSFIRKSAVLMSSGNLNSGRSHDTDDLKIRPLKVNLFSDTNQLFESINLGCIVPHLFLVLFSTVVYLYLVGVVSSATVCDTLNFTAR
jgi:hypothetical protein